MDEKDIREYAEGYPVEVTMEKPSNDNHLTEPRLVVVAYNEGHFNSTAVDIVDLLQYLKEHYPNYLENLK